MADDPHAALVRQIESRGGRVRRGKAHRVVLDTAGRIVTLLPDGRTSSRSNDFKASLRALRRAGLID